jgi:nitroreductase
MLHEILNTARRSPTSSNMQAYSFVVVRNPETKKKLAVLAGNQRHIETCDTFVACCADISRLETACEMHDSTLAKNLENTLVASVDAAIAGMTLEIAAESFGLGAVMIGGMRNHPQQAADLLGFPPGVFIVYGMCLGWPDEDQRPVQKPRLPQEAMIHFEQYDTSDKRDLLRDHDRDLAAHYEAQGRNLDKAAWTGVMAQKFSTPRRPQLRATLEKMGFSFD